MPALSSPLALRRLLPVLIVLVTCIVFAPAVRNEFVTWDDMQMFPGNSHYRGLGWTQLAWMWTTFHVFEFMPLTWMTYGADYLLWGLKPFGYHLTNLILHILTTLAVYVLAVRLYTLGRSRVRETPAARFHLAAGLAALLFAVHPLRAEPVAWVSARGTILGGFFLILSTTAYLRACDQPDGARGRLAWLAGSVGLFVLALLSRSTSLMLPVVLVALDVYPLRRLGSGAGRWLGSQVRHVWLEKLPFVVLSMAVIPFALLARYDRGPVVAHAHDLMVGTAAALFGIVFYLKKTFLLGSFSPLYERPPDFDPLGWPFMLSGGQRAPDRRPATLARGADGLGVLPGCPGADAGDRSLRPSDGRGSLYLRRLPRLAPPRGCWRAGLQPDPGPARDPGPGSRGERSSDALRDRGLRRPELESSPGLARLEDAVEPHGGRRATIRGRAPQPGLFEQDGDLTTALTHYRHSVQAWPADAKLHTNMGRVLARQGRLSEAVTYFQNAVGLRPDAADAQLRLGMALVSEGRVAEGIARYRDALRIKPDSPAIHYRLGLALAEQGELDEAIQHYRTVVALRPGFDEARSKLGLALERLGTSPPGRKP